MPQKRKISASEAAIMQLRWRARTDLIFLCNEVLGYKDVSRELNGPIVEMLQKFPYPEGEQWLNDVYEGGKWVYKPLVPIMELSGSRRNLILDPRSHFKTTVNAQAHTIQWILNYPNVALAIFQSNTEKAELILREIKRHFQFNPVLRELFPEHCPKKNPADWGTVGQFTTEAREQGHPRREPTVMTLSIEKGTAGLHFDCMKFSDIVEPENTKTRERMASVKKAFYLAESLLVGPGYWIDVEGTRYDPDDLYGELILRWEAEKKAGQEPEYRIHVRSVFQRDFGGGPEVFDPGTLRLPLKKDANGDPIPIWAYDKNGGERFTLPRLKAMQSRDEYIFSAQYMNQPVGGIDGQMVFEVSSSRPVRITRENFERNVPVAYRVLSVDTAETVGQRSNFSCIVAAAFDRTQRCYVEDIIHGKFLPNLLVDKMIEACRKYRPDKMFIEKTSFTTGLQPHLLQQMQRGNVHTEIVLVPRDTQQAKTARIYQTLQPWYRDGSLRFVTGAGGIPQAAWDAMIRELETFPLGVNDDILDALSDLTHGKEWFGDLHARPQTPQSAEDLAQEVRQRAFTLAIMGGFEEGPRGGPYTLV